MVLLAMEQFKGCTRLRSLGRSLGGGGGSRGSSRPRRKAVPLGPGTPLGGRLTSRCGSRQGAPGACSGGGIGRLDGRN